MLKDSGRVQYVSVTDTEALDAFYDLTKVEGIIPALESSHAVAYVKQLSSKIKKDSNIVINPSGRGDKDLNTVAEIKGISL